MLLKLRIALENYIKLHADKAIHFIAGQALCMAYILVTLVTGCSKSAALLTSGIFVIAIALLWELVFDLIGKSDMDGKDALASALGGCSIQAFAAVLTAIISGQ